MLSSTIRFSLDTFTWWVLSRATSLGYNFVVICEWTLRDPGWYRSNIRKGTRSPHHGFSPMGLTYLPKPSHRASAQEASRFILSFSIWSGGAQRLFIS